jgi:hypothetical protein
VITITYLVEESVVVVAGNPQESAMDYEEQKSARRDHPISPTEDDGKIELTKEQLNLVVGGSNDRKGGRYLAMYP